MGQIRHDNIADSLGESRKDWSNDMTDPEMSQRGAECFVEPTVKKMTMMHPEPGTSSGTGCLFSEDALVEEVKSSPQQVRNEVLIHYNMYGVVPLSPIQEESWSEFSEMEKGIVSCLSCFSTVEQHLLSYRSTNLSVQSGASLL